MFALVTGAAFAAWRLGYDARLGSPVIIVTPRWTVPLAALSVLLFGTSFTCAIWRATRRYAGLPAVFAVAALVASRGAVYSPLQLLRWQFAFRSPAASRVLVQAWLVTAIVGLSMSIALVAAWRRRAIARSATSSHGSARWGEPATLMGTRGVLIGKSDAELLRFDGEGHILTIAPTRSGKGVSCVIPNLLEYPGSALVTDPKGENYAVTAGWRRRAGQDVHALDPFDVVDGLAAYNPLDLVDVTTPDAVDDARMLADMLVVSDGKDAGDQSFWNEEARGLLTGLILHAASSPRPELRTLTEVRDLLTQPPDAFQSVLKAMSKSSSANGLVARAAARISQKADRERSGVISTAQSHTHFLDSPRMQRVLGTSTFTFQSLKTDPTTIYLVLPTDRIDGYARWLRLMIACGLLAVTRARGQPKDRVLFLLDEFAHLRRMHPVQRDIGLAGGFGVRFWLILQDLSQLRGTYGETWQTFLANVDLLQAFGTSDWDTAEYLSKMTGEATIQVSSENRSSGVSRGRSSQRQQGAGWSTSEIGRRLLFPDEVRRLPRDQQLLFAKATAPMLTERINYLADPPFSARAERNPLYEPISV